MKRNDDGYVLPLVLVVLLVMGIVASSVLTASLQNLKIQNKSIEKMEDKYVAEGKIEVAVANLTNILKIEIDSAAVETNQTTNSTEDTETDSNEVQNTENSGETSNDPTEGTEDQQQGGDETQKGDIKFTPELLTEIKNQISSESETLFGGIDAEIREVKNDPINPNGFLCIIDMLAKSSTRQIDCTVELSAKLELNEEETKYLAESIKIHYTAYQIGGAEE